MRRTLVLLLVITAALAGAGRAEACSCAQANPREALQYFPAAFVGQAVSREQIGEIRTVWTFSVERAVKGELAETVEVESGLGGGDCGFEFEPGDRVGLFLRGSPGAWTSGLCYMVDPDELLAAVEPLPAPDGAGPVELLVGGAFGEARLVALDGDARVLGYGLGEGTVLDLAVCAGSQRVVELVRRDGVGLYALAFRDLATLAIEAERPLVLARSDAYPWSVACRDAAGDDVVVFERSDSGPDAITRAGPDGSVPLWQGAALFTTFVGERAYVCAGELGRRAVLVDLSAAEPAPARGSEAADAAPARAEAGKRQTWAWAAALAVTAALALAVAVLVGRRRRSLGLALARRDPH